MKLLFRSRRQGTFGPPHDGGQHHRGKHCLSHRICGSDVHYLCHGRIGVSLNALMSWSLIFLTLDYQDFVVKDPMVLGHESAGVVVDGK